MVKKFLLNIKMLIFLLIEPLKMNFSLENDLAPDPYIFHFYQKKAYHKINHSLTNNIK